MISRRLLSFALAGAAGFLVDAGVLQLLVGWAGLEVHAARVLSFLAAAGTTWRFNRRYAFRAGRGESVPEQLREWLQYLWSSSAGGLVNYGVFSLIIACAGNRGIRPLIGVAVGSLAGMCVNFVLYSRFVFRSRHPQVVPGDQYQ